MASLLREKLGMIDQHASIEDAVNSIVKLLNQSTKDMSTSAALIASTVYGLDGVEFSQSWSMAGNVINASYTFTHNLGTVPSAFIITDNTASGSIGGGHQIDLIRTSSNSTNITIHINATFNNAGPYSGTFKILVLR